MKQARNEEDGEMTMEEFVQKHSIQMRVEPSRTNPAMADDDWSRSARHWLCTIKAGKREMSIHFSQGSGLHEEPKVEDVVNALALDAATYLNARDFEDWASDLGYNTDSRQAEHTYHLVARQTRAAERLLGREGLNELISETDPL